MKTAEQIAEELWEKHSAYSGHYGFRIVAYNAFTQALQEYGELVRQRAAGACRDISGNEPSGNSGRFGALDCAAVIERMELP